LGFVLWFPGFFNPEEHDGRARRAQIDFKNSTAFAVVVNGHFACGPEAFVRLMGGHVSELSFGSRKKDDGSVFGSIGYLFMSFRQLTG
jgi:hypothetical protein